LLTPPTAGEIRLATVEEFGMNSVISAEPRFVDGHAVVVDHVGVDVSAPVVGFSTS
jgi:hypothetical protein